ncbi:MAG: hypothetical protein K0S23_3749 [Fluviicola sp.]|jgi:hypothetical protein|uniref:hypothetical protein n=1 Tax=Fluviicola sp. TaxID=1917219 RepID=UPI002612A524|nr:hypothetical protein [Fluviicola sp.]MDF3029442.1 hypothetical protein [Fluviicola sp.]
MKRFLALLIPIVLLLIAIPFLLNNGLIVPAKVVGVVLILLTTISLRIWLRRALREKLSLDAIKFNVNHRYYLNEVSPIYRNMSKAEKKALEKRMGKLLADLQFDDTTREELNVDEMLSYALIQILAVYNESYRSLKGKMIVFDQTNNTGELKISEGKYVLVNPVLLESILKEAQTMEAISSSNKPVIGQLRDFYLNV